MDGPVQDGICNCGIWKSGMPIGDRYLRDNDRGGLGKAVIEHFQQILRCGDWDGITHPVIQDQHVDSLIAIDKKGRMGHLAELE